MNISTQLRKKIDFKTKPLGALGTLEKIAQQIGEIQNTLSPKLVNPTIITFAGDHGIAAEGVSAYPQEVTYQMVTNFINGGAAINVFCKQHNIDLKIVDAGVNFDFDGGSILIDAKVGKGTKSFLREKAMTPKQLKDCFKHAEDLIGQVNKNGCNIIGFGEMGIGNTSSATMIISNLTELPIEKCIGRGTGLNDVQLVNKVRTLKEAQTYHSKIEDPMEVLQTFGGFEVAQMCGAMLSAFEKNMVILIDGFIASSAFLVAYKLKPEIMNNAIFCHLSDEFGHYNLLNYLNVEPLLKINMRVGEGTGCAVAYPIIESAVAFLNNMASFDTADVSNKA